MPKVNFVPLGHKKLRGHGGYAECIPFLPIATIYIAEKYRYDLGLIKHEKTHVDSHHKSWYTMPIWYFLCKDYRLKEEIKCYRRQVAYYPLSTDLTFIVKALMNNYRLKLSEDKAWEIVNTEIRPTLGLLVTERKSDAT
jgi:hypothetical protein